MKSPILLLLVSTVLGLGLGVGLAYIEVPTALNDPYIPESNSSNTSDLQAEVPQAEVPETVFRFGNIERGTTMSHVFIVKNVGNSPLYVEVASTTCKCTVGNLSTNEILPGEESEVLLEWMAKTPPSPFRHGAILSTTDPNQSSINLTVEGQVVESTAMSPAELIFGIVRSGESAEASLYLMSFLGKELEVTDYQLSNDELAENLEIAIEPAELSELPSPDATSGVKITAKYQSGKTVGPFRCWLTLNVHPKTRSEASSGPGNLSNQTVSGRAVNTKLDEAQKLEIPIAATVVGDVTIFGPGWNADRGLLRIGAFSSAEGKKASVTVSVRGENAQDAKWEVLEVDPPQLHVSVGEPRKMGGKLSHVPLLIEIPAGSAPIVRLGEPVSSDAHIVLRSNHEEISDVRLRVQFAVE